MDTSTTKVRVFVVENDFVLCETLESLLEQWGFELAGTATTATDAIKKIPASNAHIVLLDMHLDCNENGLTVAHYIRTNHSIPFIFMSGTNDVQTIYNAKTLNPAAYLVKPFAWENLYTTLYMVSDHTKSILL